VAEFVVVTGTDTGVGKTIATAALASRYLAEGRSVAVVKPAQTGVAPGDEGDVDVVARLAPDVTTYELARFPDPLAPATAARVAGRTAPDLCAVRDGILKAGETADVVLVEGAGGVLVELGDAFNLLDVAQLLVADGQRVVFVVVARSGLGTLNHSALTTWAIAQRGLTVEGIVIGSWPEVPSQVELLNLQDLPTIAGVPVLGVLPEGAATLGAEEFATAVTALSLPEQ
jgi:dethiobiotin synthetase